MIILEEVTELKKRASILLLALALLIGTIPAVSAAGLTDTAGLACEEAVTALHDAGIIGGMPDGTYAPERTLTRAEAATLLSRMLPLVTTAVNTTTNDIAGHWAEADIRLCLGNGYLSVLEDGTFAPHNPMDLYELRDITRSLLGPQGPEPREAATTVTRGDAAEILFDFWKTLNTPLAENGPTHYSQLKTKLLLEYGNVLRPFALAGYYENNMLNAVALTADPATYVWNADAGFFAEADADAATLVYNFVAVMDADGDKLGDTLFVVNNVDSETYWDADMQYTDPRAAGDSAYADAFSNAYNIPYGQRLLGFANARGYLDGAAVDYANIVAPGDLDASSYYPTYDFYNSTSTDTLTMLTGFRTIQQSTGWACGVTSALMAMDWYNLRGDLNELDLGALRDKKNADGDPVWSGATDVQMLINVFTSLNAMEGKDLWNWESTYDFVDADGKVADEYLSAEWIQETLGSGIPVLVGWNSFGAHWQVIIGYDNMGTETTADDVLILADPYDSTDHRNDGYTIQSYERLYYDWTQNFDSSFSRNKGYGLPVMFAPYPADYDKAAFAPVMGDGLAKANGTWDMHPIKSEEMLLPYGDTAADLAASSYAYAQKQTGENGLAGPASDDWYRAADVAESPYYYSADFFTGEGLRDSLILLKGFQTSQQASEWTCGLSSARMVLAWFDKDGGQSEFALAGLRQNDKEGATTLDGMIDIFTAQEGFAWLSTDDMYDDGNVGAYNLYDGTDGLIPACLKAGIPVIAGWNEWGGHWQVIIGYDDMGTEDTQDDVLILADPYDTTDHNQDGYVVESYERLVYGWGAAFDPRGGDVFLIAAPSELILSLADGE